MDPQGFQQWTRPLSIMPRSTSSKCPLINSKLLWLRLLVHMAKQHWVEEAATQAVLLLPRWRLCSSTRT